MTLILNSAEGGSSGTTVTASNSGGNSGRPFDTVVLGTGAALTFDNAHAAHSSLSYKISTGATAATSYMRWASTSVGTQTVTVYFRVYAYLTANPAAAIRLVTFLDSTNAKCATLWVNTSGAPYMTNAADTTVAGPLGSSISLNSWVRIEGFVTPSTTVGQVSLALYNTTDSNTSTASNTSAASQVLTANVANALFGLSFGQANVSAFWLDDMGVSTTGLLGPGGGFLDSDSGAGSESSQSINVPASDSGAGSETHLTSATVPSGETTSCSEVSSVVSSVSDRDSASGSELNLTLASVLASDSGSGSETNLTSATVTSPEISVCSETSSVVSYLSDYDPSSGSDSQFAGVSHSDSSSVSEASSVISFLSGYDFSSGSEYYYLISSDYDSGSASDAGSLNSSSYGLDSGSSSESYFEISYIYQSDSGSIQDSSSSVAQVSSSESSGTVESYTYNSALSDQDSSFTLDYVSFSGVYSLDSASSSESSNNISDLSDADYSSESESYSYSSSVYSADSGSLSETTSEISSEAESDSASATESSQAAYSPSDYDFGSVADLSVFSTLRALDAGSAAENSLTEAFSSEGDAGSASDLLQLTVPDADAGYAIPGGQQVITAMVSDSSAGVGIDDGMVAGQPRSLSDSDTASATEGSAGLPVRDSDSAVSAEATQTEISQYDHGYAIPGGQQVITSLIFAEDYGQFLSDGRISGGFQYPGDSDFGSGADALLVSLAQTDSGQLSELQSVPGQMIDVSDVDTGSGADSLLAEWGASWGAIILDMQISGVRMYQSAGVDADLVLLAEEGLCPDW